MTAILNIKLITKEMKVQTLEYGKFYLVDGVEEGSGVALALSRLFLKDRRLSVLSVLNFIFLREFLISAFGICSLNHNIAFFT